MIWGGDIFRDIYLCGKFLWFCQELGILAWLCTCFAQEAGKLGSMCNNMGCTLYSREMWLDKKPNKTKTLHTMPSALEWFLHSITRTNIFTFHIFLHSIFFPNIFSFWITKNIFSPLCSFYSPYFPQLRANLNDHFKRFGAYFSTWVLS